MSSNEVQVTVSTTGAVHRFRDTVRIGRAPGNAIVVDHGLTSGEHLELRKVDHGWEVVDLGSEHGTFVDGERITRIPVRGLVTASLGREGPHLRIAIPRHSTFGWTPLNLTKDIADRYFSDEDPEGMSSRTAMIRAAFRVHHDKTTRSWLQRIRQMRVVILLLVIVAGGSWAITAWQARRLQALRATAGTVFNTMKALELDIRRLEATVGPDSSVQERRLRLEAQYDDLIKTLGIYSDRTPADVRLIYATIRRLGESEATVPQGFIEEVKQAIDEWKGVDLETSFRRAQRLKLGALMAEILNRHHLPREFFYIALQESKLDPEAVGPASPLGAPKGLWQLIPSTAEAYGLRLGPLQGDRQFDPLDERHDPAKATAAAARYLQDIYLTDAQASGLLVLTSYNMGGPRMRGILRTLPDGPTERNYWALIEKRRAQLPNETYHYVLRIVAAAVIGGNPGLFGHDFPPPFGAADSLASGQ